MSRIAAAAGISKPVLYDHFPSKDAMFGTLLRSIRDELLAKGRAIGQSSASREDRFRSAIDAFFAFVETQPDAARLLLIVPHGDPVTVKLSRDVQQAPLRRSRNS
jgi:AcrR family transcriptional regulator